MSLKGFVAELDEWLARAANSGLSEEIEKHEETVGCLAGVKGIL